MANRKYSWKPDLPDRRDLLYQIPAHMADATKLPKIVYLSSGCGQPYDQGALGSCTANATGKAFEFDLRKQGLPFFIPSRLFIYYNERATEGTTGQDAGAMIRDGVKSLHKMGVCAETLWPYSDENPGPFMRRPTTECYTEAAKHLLTSYARVPRSLHAMKACIASGYPFVFGFTVYDGFESPSVAATGIVNMPRPSEGVLGGHAVLCAGYDDTSQRFLVLNSWSRDWGQAGYFTMPYAYLLDDNLSDDFWTLRAVASL